jgi:transposase
MTVYLGLDVHARETVYCAEEERGEVIGAGRVRTTGEGLREMLERLQAPEGTWVGLESGPQSFWVSRLLRAWGMAPVVLDANEVRRKAARPNQKCDRRDAREICEGVRRGIYATVVYVPPLAVERLRRVLAQRRHFVRIGTSQVNAAKSLLRGVGLGSSATTLSTEAAWAKLLARPEVSEWREAVARHGELWRTAKAQEVELDRALTEALQPLAEEHRRLMTVPGVGRIVAAAFLAALGEPGRFVEGGRVVSYLGLAPSSWSSGEQERRGHLTKRGNAEARAMLVEAAHHAGRPRHPLNPYFRRVMATGGYKKAVVAVAQRLARILWRMWRAGEEFDPRKLNVVAEKYQSTRTYYWRLKSPAEPRPSV